MQTPPRCGSTGPLRRGPSGPKTYTIADTRTFMRTLRIYSEWMVRRTKRDIIWALTVKRVYRKGEAMYPRDLDKVASESTVRDTLNTMAEMDVVKRDVAGDGRVRFLADDEFEATVFERLADEQNKSIRRLLRDSKYE